MKLIQCPKCKGKGRVDDPASVGKHFREMRSGFGLSLRSVAKKIGISAPYLCDLELGRRHMSDRLKLAYMDAVESLRDKNWKA